MNNNTKNKFLIGIVVLLILANITSIAMFWIDKPNPKTNRQKGTPAAFLITALNLDEKQQEQLEIYREEHKRAAEPLRKELVNNKKIFFGLLQQPESVDTQKINVEEAVLSITQKLDLLAFDHFRKVRNICTETQKEKFDKIILQVAQILGNPGDPHPPGDRPPLNDGDGNMPPRNDEQKRPPPENN